MDDEFKVRAERLVKAVQDADQSYPQGPQPEPVEECAWVLASIALSPTSPPLKTADIQAMVAAAKGARQS